MIAWAFNGGKSPPAWLAVLLMAEDWGCPPWEVTGERPTGTARKRWAWRWLEYRAQKAKKLELDGKHG